MIRGVYSDRNGDRGPLSVDAAGPHARTAEVDGVTCALDGRVYNAADLAGEVGGEPADDAAVLALAYRRSATRMLERLRGSFSLVIWDAADRRGVLSCDLLATRQLFFSRANGGLLFATELHELLSLVP